MTNSFRFTAIALVAGIFAIGSTFPEPHSETLQLQTDQGRIEWTGKAAFGDYALTGTLQPKSGQMVLQHGVVIGGSVVIDMTSLKQEIPDVVAHLGSKDFLNIKQHPEATLTLTKKVQLPCTKCQATAELELLGKKQVEAVTLTFTEESGQMVCQFDFSFDRTKYGMIANSPDHFPKIGENEAVANEVKLKGRLVFKR